MDWITNPLDKELSTMIMVTYIEDTFYFVFKVVIDGDGWRRRDWDGAVRNRGGFQVRTKEGNMEDRVDTKVRG